jgi:carbonic anhydrase
MKNMSAFGRSPTCSCCGDLLNGGINRRHFVRLAGGAALATAFPLLALSADGQYDAMVLSCIDPRFPELTLNYLKGRGMLGKYSQFAIAGAGIGVVAPAFKDWHKAFWDNLAASIELHRVPKVIVLDHRDCGACRIAYGQATTADPRVETETHRAALMEFRKQVNDRQPKLTVETGLMALDGTVEMFG